MTSNVASVVHDARRGVAGRRLLVAGGVLSACNGAVHLVLPLVYPWDAHTQDLYEPVRWALYAGTIFFGLLLLWAGLLVTILARRSDLPPPVERWVFGGVAAFWVLGAGYELVVPFPAPVADVALPIFSLVVAGLLLAGLWLRGRVVDQTQYPDAAAADDDTGGPR